MTNDTNTTAPETTTSQAPDLGKMSFSEYEAMRRGEKVESVQSAPETKSHVQKTESTESETVEKKAGELNEESDESESHDDKDESEESDKDKPKKKGGFQRRIDKLNARHSAAQQEIEYWKTQAMKNGATESPKQEPKVETKSAPDGEPNPDDFASHREYVKAVAEWTVKKDRELAKAEEEKSKLQSERESKLKTHIDRVKSFADKVDDFEDMMENLDDVPRSQTVEKIIVESENGPELLYALAKDPKEAKRICSLGAVEAARELGKFEAKLITQATEESKPEPKKITSAPKPIATVGGTKGAVAKSIDDPNISFADYERLRRKQLERR